MTRSGMLLLALLAMPAWAEESVDKLVGCMRANVPAQLTIGRLELTVYDRVGGSRQMKGRMFTRKEPGGAAGLMTASLRIDTPAEFKGAAYLVRETDDYLRDGMFVYLPSVKRVRRVTGTFADASLLGTNFSYYDFKQLQNAFGDLSATLEPGNEHVNGRPTTVLSFKALQGVDTRYSGVKTWIDREACVGVRAEFYEGRKLVKELSSPAGSLQKAGNTWYLSEIEMREPAAGTRTVLRIGGLDSASAPPSRYFDSNAFFMGP